MAEKKRVIPAINPRPRAMENKTYSRFPEKSFLFRKRVEYPADAPVINIRIINPVNISIIFPRRKKSCH